MALVLVLAACSTEEDLGGEVVDDGLGCQVSEVDRSTEAPTIEAGTEVPETTEFETTTDAAEDACVPTADQYLTLDLIGATADDGTVFNDTFGDGTPLTVRLGQNQLIAGLETGLAEMQVGEQRTITVPAAEAYGPDGNEAQGIGPDEDLVFVVELVSATDSPVYCNPATVPEGVRDDKPTEVAVPTEPPTDEVKTTVLEEGDGREVTAKDYVTVDYLGVSCATGQQFDSSWDREEPIQVALAEAEPTATVGGVIPGWTEGLVGQKVGSLVQLDIPFEQAYGAAGSPPAIGPSDPLTFVVRIVEVSDEAPADPTTTTTAEGGTETTAPAG
jgi:peptidylprolyl isomerase